MQSLSVYYLLGRLINGFIDSLNTTVFDPDILLSYNALIDDAGIFY